MKHRRSVIVSVLFGYLFVFSFLWPWKGETRGSFVERSYLLENGLKVVLVENHASPIVSSNVMVKAGVSTEPSDMNGVSHFLEHLLFNGTERRTQKKLYDEVDFYGAYNNAFTRDDFTVFQMIIASPFLEQGLDIQSDMLFHSIIPEENFEKEKKIVIEEIEKDRSQPDYLADLFFREKAFQGTPYSKPILGTASSISRMKRKEVLAYYKKYYVPDNMSLFLFGDFDSEKALMLIRQYFGTNHPLNKGKRGKIHLSIKKQKDIIGREKSSMIKKREMDALFKRGENLYRNHIESGRNYLDILTKAPDLESEDFIPFCLLLSILSDGEDSRLYRSLKGRGDPLIFQYSLDHPLYGGQGLLHFSATLPENVPPEKAADIYFRELQKVAEEGITKKELEKAQQSIKASEVYMQEKLHYYAVMRGAWLAFSKPGFIESFLSRIEEEDLPHLHVAARRYMKNLSPVITISGPGQEEGIEKYDVPSYLREEEKVTEKGIKKKILDNGMTIIVQAEESSAIFAVHILIKNRSIHEPDGKTGIADLTHRMLMKGTAIMDASELSEAMKEIGARIKVADNPMIPYDDYYTSSFYSYIRFETLSEYYRRGLRLLRDIVFHPSFPEEEMHQVVHEMIDIIEKNEEKVSEKVKDLFLSRVYEGSKLGNSVYGNKKAIHSITREDLLSFHQKYFSPQNMIISIVSQIPVEEVMKSMEEIFGKIRPQAGELEEIPEIHPTTRNERYEIEMGKPQSYIYEGYLFHMERGDIPALMIANAILSNRMAFELRERQGLAYRIGSSLCFFKDTGLFFVSMGTRPENLEKAIDGIEEQIRSLARDRPTVKEVEKTVHSLIGRIAMRRISGINRAYFLGLSEFQGRGYDEDLDFITRLRDVTPDHIQEMARKYLSGSTMILVAGK